MLQKYTTYYSVALDESTDATDSSQVLYFIHAITEEYDVKNYLLCAPSKGGHKELTFSTISKRSFVRKL